MKKVYKEHKKAEASAGRGDDTLEKKWSRFLKVFEQVGRAVEDEESDSTGSTDGENNSAGNRTLPRLRRGLLDRGVEEMTIASNIFVWALAAVLMETGADTTTRAEMRIRGGVP
jgi:hypothetical protein